MHGKIKTLAAVLAILTTTRVALPAAPFVLSSPDKQLTVRIPEIYMAKVFGCHGGNMSPELTWSGVPAGTKSLSSPYSMGMCMTRLQDGGTGRSMMCLPR